MRQPLWAIPVFFGDYMVRLIIDDCHDCADWAPADSYGCGTVCGGLSNYPAVPEVGENAPIPEWCPRLAKQSVENWYSTLPLVKRCTT